MKSHYIGPNLASLDAADRIARSAYLWLRQRAISCGISFALGGQLNDAHHTQLIIAGFIFELCEALKLTPQHCLLAAYAYALLDGGDADPLVIAAILAMLIRYRKLLRCSPRVVRWPVRCWPCLRILSFKPYRKIVPAGIRYQ